MKAKKNLRETTDEEIEIELDADVDPTKVAPWYDQFLKLDERKRATIVARAMDNIRKTKPDTHQFIRKFNCEVVGVCPRVEYALCKDSDGEMDVTWIHSFSLPTLLFWCKQGGFGFFVNPNLRYNDSVLNELDGNKLENLRGFTA